MVARGDAAAHLHVEKALAYAVATQDFAQDKLERSATHGLRDAQFVEATVQAGEVALGVQRTDEEYREILGLVIEQCSYLQTLVNQLLLLAETDAERLLVITPELADELSAIICRVVVIGPRCPR